MPTPTYVPLATITLATSDNDVSFTSIPATYRDLIIIVNGFGAVSSGTLALRYNGDTGSNYSFVRMIGYSGGALGTSATGQNYIMSADYSTTEQHATIIQVMDYSATDRHKTNLTRSNRAGTWTFGIAGRWANTAAVTSLNLVALSNNFASGTTFSLYGVN